MLLNRIFYTLKPAIPRRLQIFVRRQIALYKRKKYEHVWPIDTRAASPPREWNGWPDDKKFAFVLTHDIDTQNGYNRCMKVAKLEEKIGFSSSFNFVPERYKNSDSLHVELRERGFDIGIHGLKHDGKLFSSHRIFYKRVKKINAYLKKWKVIGFTAPSMHHKAEWLHALDIKYSTSTFDTDPFEPQPDGVRTIFPYWVQDTNSQKGYIELPYTLPQDHLLFIILKEKNIDIWKKKLDWIVEKGGMALLNTHSDYMNFYNGELGNEEYPINYYLEFLEYVKERYGDKYWNALPKDVARFWKKRINE